MTARGSHGRDKGIPVHFLGLTDSTIQGHAVPKSCQLLLFLTNLGSHRQPAREGESRESPRDKGDLGSYWDVSVIPSLGLASHKHQGSLMHSGTLLPLLPHREGRSKAGRLSNSDQSSSIHVPPWSPEFVTRLRDGAARCPGPKNLSDEG